MPSSFDYLKRLYKNKKNRGLNNKYKKNFMKQQLKDNNNYQDDEKHSESDQREVIKNESDENSSTNLLNES